MTLRGTVLVVAGLNLAYFFVEAGVAVAIGSVSLLADSVDFLEDAAVNLLVVVALGWAAAAQARVGRLMSLVILLPALAAAWQAFAKLADPVAPDPWALTLTAGGAVAVNSVAAMLLVRVRHRAGSMTQASWLAARNDVLVNLAIIAMWLVTAATGSGWPDIALGVVIVVLNVTAAREVWELATEEGLAAKAVACEDLD